MRSVAFIAKADRSINFRVTRHRALMVLPCRLILVPLAVRWHVHSYRKMYEWQAFLNYNLTFIELYGGDVHVYRGTWTCPEYLRPGPLCTFVLHFERRGSSLPIAGVSFDGYICILTPCPANLISSIDRKKVWTFELVIVIHLFLVLNTKSIKH